MKTTVSASGMGRSVLATAIPPRLVRDHARSRSPEAPRSSTAPTRDRPSSGFGALTSGRLLDVSPRAGHACCIVAEPGLPAGTVTFLFTDVEGSTRLLGSIGQHRYDELLTAHHDILTAVFEAHGGRVVDTQGDSFFVAFRTAADAVAAAVAAQRDLTAYAWPDGAEIKVRMGLHTGEPKVGEERYVGIGVHRAARIGAAGHGGQVLLSWTTKGLAEEDLPAGVTIRDLGERLLKDIEQPQRLYQLVIDGLVTKFGPLKTLDVELTRKRRRMYAGSAVVGVLAAAVAIPVFAFGQGGSGGGITVQGNAVAEIDPGSNHVVGQVPNVGARPSSIAYGSGSLWVANLDDQTVTRIDPKTTAVTRTFSVAGTPTGLAASPRAVWVVGSIPTGSSIAVARIDPRFDSVGKRVLVGNVVPGGPGSVATLGDAVWVAPSSGLLSRVNPGSGRVVQQVDPNAGPTAVAVGAGAVWVTDSDANTVTRIDPTGLQTPIPVGHGPSGIAVGADGVWVADTLDDAVVRIDPTTRAVTATVPVGRAPTGVAIGEGSVWVAGSGDGTVTRIDQITGKRVKTIDVGGSPHGIVVAANRIWASVQPRTAEPAEAGQGGTAHVRVAQNVVDPWIPRSPTSHSRGSCSTPRARSCSTIRTSPAPRARGWYPRLPSRYRNARPTARPTPSPSAEASASRRPRTNR